MKAVFLDAGTFSPQIDLSLPSCISAYERFDSTDTDAQILARCHDADIIITNKVLLGKDIIAQLPKLKLVQISATGINNVDLQACQAHGVSVQNVAGYSVKSVPEHTFMLMLNALRAGNYYHRTATDGSWQADGRFCLLNEPIFDLAGRTLGIIGAGNIGKRVGEIARAFGMAVLYAEHQGKAPRSPEYTAFDDVLAKADVISLHCPLTDSTANLINAQTIAKMQKQPLIINVARGGVVDSQAVVDALHAGQILGYASDVFAHEPFADDEPLLAVKNHPRVFFTPHNAWGSLGAQQKLWKILCDNVAGFVANFKANA
ncbi:hydroxyacid dehydrogenase [Moraxella caviae]|uniref:Hydroxyacid dehydrogenase n=1 Tax=Moraxella caviae TaxID=34060 RepID=A0A1T0A0V1_9GAMM|nr:D-2-hydroxyacid dehydrogenase [Moraxella caviae]OOR89384.1 hydroxyacid dehydrogenase [Moraxella caviae]STZ09895.1 Putative 2-hydroxyacid dehydrogenase HI_1556 [Moraxella caviae]VEW13231.1 Putative 2-hydroxyacid dehydrogenase HI_1556 [Moraxella caviae]